MVGERRANDGVVGGERRRRRHSCEAGLARVHGQPAGCTVLGHRGDAAPLVVGRRVAVRDASKGVVAQGGAAYAGGNDAETGAIERAVLCACETCEGVSCEALETGVDGGAAEVGVEGVDVWLLWECGGGE